MRDSDKPQQPEPSEDLLTVPEVADRLKVRDETVRDWLRRNEISGYNFGGRTGWRIPASEIARLLAARTGKRSVNRKDKWQKPR